MRKYWMLGLFGGLALTFPGYGGDVKTGSDDVEITLGGEVRARYSHRDNLTYTQGAAHASDDVTILRTRLNVGVKVGKDVSAKIQLQDSHTTGAATTGNATGAPGTAGTDTQLVMREGYIVVSDLFEMPLDLMVGRMGLHYGHGRVINDLNWSNSPRHFDAALVKYTKDENTWLDIAALDIQNQGVNSTTGTGAARADDDNEVYFAYGHTKMGDTVVEAYNIWERDGFSDRGGEKFAGVSKNLSRHTTGVLVEHSLADFDASAEYIRQWGDAGTDRVDASAFALELGYNMGDKANTSINYEYTTATGNGDPADGKQTRFRSPFHFNHAYQGYADLVGFTNMNAHKIQASTDISKSTSATAAYHVFHRNERDDSWYAAGGAVQRSGGLDVSKNSQQNSSNASDIGQELDLKINHQYNDHLEFELGWSHFFEGTLARETDPTLGDVDFAWLQMKLDF